MIEPLFALWVPNIPDQADGYITEIEVAPVAPGIVMAMNTPTSPDPKRALLRPMSVWLAALGESRKAASGSLAAFVTPQDVEEIDQDMRFVPASELGR